MSTNEPRAETAAPERKHVKAQYGVEIEIEDVRIYVVDGVTIIEGDVVRSQP